MPLIASKPWFNLIWFQVFWFTAVIGQHQAVLPLILMLAIHFLLLSQRSKELLLIILCAPLGIATDSLLHYFSVFEFTQLSGGLIPFWLMGLWIAFSATLRHGMAFFLPRPFLAAICGAVAGPLSYFAGQRLGAVDFGLPLLTTLLLLAVLWAILFPLFIFIANRVNGQTRQVAA
ncbi:DUF2878 domain-containing protein [Lacimicrobium alkaliphilum]|uniref:Membrane protein n=1 Tax=Lacimicrobium alkaliphilum TaxID=1526571 RepID=A0ABQ1RF42_9ALTE|nr:DUF2878 domain-containing protein [Lacimicrobium alkaliphilum]GGD66311.1 membrane protein [Lacimicrobium alkaliphilum]